MMVRSWSNLEDLIMTNVIRLVLCCAVAAAFSLPGAAAEAEKEAPPVAAKEAPRKAPADLGAFIKEIMTLKIDGDRTQTVLWLPHELFVQAGMADGTPRAQVEKNVVFLKPYNVMYVQCCVEKDDGTSAYAGEKQTRARAVLRLKDGTEIKPLDKIPPMVRATVLAMKTLITAEGDEGSKHMYVLVFPAQGQDGKDIVNTASQDRLTMVLKADKDYPEVVCTWHTPFDAVTPIPPCAKCREPVSAKWSFCPWCGQRIPAPAPAAAPQRPPAPPGEEKKAP
jgi:hypothetical protein